MTFITQQELKESVQLLHSEAEKLQLSQDLMNGTITPRKYKNMCYQMFLITDAVESKIKLPIDIQRRHQFVLDIASCSGDDVFICPTTRIFVDRINNINDSSHLKGVVYCLYLGWLYGGQMIAKKLPLPVNHLMFDNVKEKIGYIRGTVLININKEDLLEAQLAFQSMIDIYKELYELPSTG